MANEPENITHVLLRQIRAAQDEHSHRFDRIEKRLDEVHESMVTSLGLAAHANVRHERVDKRLDDLARRVEQLEKNQ